jgi:serine/threonine protein phosphatase PrpC
MENRMVRTMDRAPQLGVSCFQGIGKRHRQEDSFYASDNTDTALMKKRGFLAVVADGMGGMADGDKMSALVTSSAMEYYMRPTRTVRPEEGEGLKDMLRFILDRAEEMKNERTGAEEESGSTLAAVMIKNDRLHFMTVGDSHIYLFRRGKLYLMNREHNLGSRMIELVAGEKMPMESYRDTLGKSGLTSYIGKEEPVLCDMSVRPFLLQDKDMLLLMSDGVFGTLSVQDMEKLICEDCQLTANALKEAVEAAHKTKQDNYTGIVISYEI